MICNNCGAENDERNLNCSNCGAELVAEEETKKLTALLKDKKFLGISVCVLSVVIIVLLAIINSVVLPNIAAARITKAFESKNSSQVYEVYDKYCGFAIYETSSLSASGQAVFKEVREYIVDVTEDLNNQEVGTDLELYIKENYGDILTLFENFSDSNSELRDIVQIYADIRKSKRCYAQAIVYYDKGYWLNALNYFERVINSDSWYEDAQSKLTESREKLLKEKIEQIENYMNNSEYDSAQQAINVLRKKKLTDEITKRLDEYEIKIYESKLAIIDEYVNSGDMDAAKEYIDSLGDDLSSDAQARLNQAIKNKANDYIEKADEALKSGERQGAYDMALMAQNLCPDNDEINEKVQYFRNYLPLKLYVSDNYLSQKKEQSCWIYYNKKCTTNNSNTMLNCVYVSFHPWDSGMYATVTYNLGKKYNTVSGTQFITQHSKNMVQKGYFELYGDGKKMFTSSTMGVNFLPTDFSVNVTGVDTLIVKYYDIPSGGLDYPEYGISNFVATKNLP